MIKTLYDRRLMKRMIIKNYKKHLIKMHHQSKSNQSFIYREWANAMISTTKRNIKNMNNFNSHGRNINLFYIKKYYER